MILLRSQSRTGFQPVFPWRGLRCLPRVGRAVPARCTRFRPFMSVAVLCLLSSVFCWAETNIEPPTPPELGITPPPFPVPVVGTNATGGVTLAAPSPVVYVTNTVYVIPSNTIIRIQVRDHLDSGDWFEPVVFKSRTDYKFFRVLFETEALQ